MAISYSRYTYREWRSRHSDLFSGEPADNSFRPVAKRFVGGNVRPHGPSLAGIATDPILRILSNVRRLLPVSDKSPIAGTTRGSPSSTHGEGPCDPREPLHARPEIRAASQII